MNSTLNPNHQTNFTYSKDINVRSSVKATVNIKYRDRGWLNSGIECCTHDKEEYDNSLYMHRGTNNILICHTCQSYWHYDSSD